jgi:hypothetical protein
MSKVGIWKLGHEIELDWLKTTTWEEIELAEKR